MTTAPTAPPLTAADTAPVPASLTPLADGVHAYVQPDGGWCLNNAGLVVGQDRTVLIDTAATEFRARALRQAVHTVAPGGPDYVVNTHFHGDHVFGNSLFTPRATVLSHEGTRADTAEAGPGLRHLWPDVQWGDTREELASVTFRDRLTLHTGGPRVELLHVGPAHTANDVIAWVPDASVLFTGDVVWSGVTPFVLMGSISGSLLALDRMRNLGPRTVVPGHGPVGGKELLDSTEAYLRFLQKLADRGIRDHLTPLEAARKAELGPYADWLDPERLVGNLHRAYAEAQGGAPGARLDVAGPFGEMCAFHGGLPTCRA
ncbi:MBL fold metallo-hydrolase [Streptomyces sp. NPDC051561]|uniref:MBL fold metallo-hydrolase n=1 Tax=Streptomyces sp. NPDC051561 TaxID=3365658 RepID=UPI0037949F95